MSLKVLKSMIKRQPDIARRAHAQTLLEQMGLPYIAVDLIGFGSDKITNKAISLLLCLLDDGR